MCVCVRRWGVINSFGGVARGTRWQLSGNSIALSTSSHQDHGQTSNPHPLRKALPYLTHVTSQPSLVTEEMNLSVSLRDPSEPHKTPHRPPPHFSLLPPSFSLLNHLTPAVQSRCVSALMKTLGGEAISHLIPSNTLDMFRHLKMWHRLVLFGVWLHLCCGKQSRKWVMNANCLQSLGGRLIKSHFLWVCIYELK